MKVFGGRQVLGSSGATRGGSSPSTRTKYFRRFFADVAWAVLGRTGKKGEQRELWGLRSAQSPPQSVPVPSGKRFRLFAWYVGPAYAEDYTLQVSFAVGLRGDLLTRADLGRMIPCVLGFYLIAGRAWEDRERGRLNWVFRPRWRSEIGEIARRLAGGDE